MPMEVCPKCGYDPRNTIIAKPMTHEMAHYVDMKTGASIGVFNSSDDTLTVRGVQYLRQDLWLKAQAAKEAEAKMASIEKDVKDAEAKAKANPVSAGVTAAGSNPPLPTK